MDNHGNIWWSASNDNDYEYDDNELMKMEGMSQEKKNTIIKDRKLIKAGIVLIADGSNNKNKGQQDSESSSRNNNNEQF